LQNRPDLPEGESIKNVEGVDIQVAADPDLAVQVLPLGVEPAQVVVQPEAQPITAEQPIEQPAIDPAQLTADAALMLQLTAEAQAAQQAQQIQPLPTETPVLQPIAPTPAPTRDPNPVILINYVVQQNDTLYGVTRLQATSIALMSLYNISQEDLVPGTTIALPVGNPAYCPGRRPYAVGEGDTAFSVAHRYSITADDLKAINSLDNNYTIRVGEIICVP
jgi:LysM repeat protein